MPSLKTIRFSKPVVDGFTYRPGAYQKSRDTRWDSMIPGFGVRVYPSGKKAFVIWYRMNGRLRMMTIGDVAIMSLSDARSAARRQLGAVCSGADPLEQRQLAARGETVRDLCIAFFERHVEAKTPNRPNGLKSARDIRRRLEKNVIPNWGGMKSTSLKRSDVASLHRKLGKAVPYEANRTVKHISKMFNLARVWGFVPDDHVNPAEGIELFAEKERDRWVTQTEMPRLRDAIDAEANIYVRTAVWLYLLTGLRKHELLRAEWRHVDLERGILRVVETKNTTPVDQVLSPPAVALLQELPRIEGNPFVFPGRRADAHLVNIDKSWRRIRVRATVDDVRLHDLRRTVGSWLVQEGHSLALIARVLNHKSIQTTRRYARFADENIRAALDGHATRLFGNAGPKSRKELDPAPNDGQSTAVAPD